MLKRVIVCCLVVVAVASCKKAPKKEDQPNAGETQSTEANTNMNQDAAITNKDLSFDASGSDSGRIDGLYTIHFDFDKAGLSAEARDLLAKNLEWMKAHSDSSLQIEGHCDSKGSIEYNLALGERRAKAVKQYLVSLGADSKLLSVISYGEEKPVDSSATDSGDAKNRRANFVPIAR